MLLWLARSHLSKYNHKFLVHKLDKSKVHDLPFQILNEMIASYFLLQKVSGMGESDTLYSEFWDPN